jgi:hypothetical protein
VTAQPGETRYTFAITAIVKNPDGCSYLLALKVDWLWSPIPETILPHTMMNVAMTLPKSLTVRRHPGKKFRPHVMIMTSAISLMVRGRDLRKKFQFAPDLDRRPQGASIGTGRVSIPS